MRNGVDGGGLVQSVQPPRNAQLALRMGATTVRAVERSSKIAYLFWRICGFLGPEREEKAGGSENIRKAINEKHCRVSKALGTWSDTYRDVFYAPKRYRKRGNRCRRRGSKSGLTREYDDTATVAETALLSGNSDQH